MRAGDVLAPVESAAAPLAALAKAELRCIAPDDDLYSFAGNIVIEEDETAEPEPEPEPPAARRGSNRERRDSCSIMQFLQEDVSSDHLLLRGSSVRNTAWVVGLVVYTGRETKEMMNSHLHAPFKRSRLERTLNGVCAFMLFAQTLCSAIAAVAHSAWVTAEEEEHWYLFSPNEERPHDANEAGFFVFWSYFVLLNTFIPSSLVVTIEVVKACYALLIMWDVRMQHFVWAQSADGPARALRAAIPRTTALTEELGQISWLFSDKTGTLTENEMVLRRIFVADSVYSDDPDTTPGAGATPSRGRAAAAATRGRGARPAHRRGDGRAAQPRSPRSPRS